MISAEIVTAKPLNALTDEIEILIEKGLRPEMAREAASNRRRERLREPPILIEGCITLADAMPDTAMIMFPVLVQGQVITLTGRPGHGKSTLGMALAYALALQRDLGPIKPKASGLVYFVSAEDANGTRKRIFAEAICHKLTPDERTALNTRLRWVHVNTTLHPAVIADEIARDAGGRRTVAIFVDTGAALFAGDDENSNAQLQDFAVSCRAFTAIDGAPCVVVFWHPVKNAAADNLTPRGGSALLGAVDGNLTLWSDDEGTVTLAHTPAKWRADPFEPIEFTLDPVALVLPSGVETSIRVARPKIATEAQDEGKEATQRRERLLLALLVAEPDDGLTIRRLAAQVEMSKSTLQRELKHLSEPKSGLIEPDPISGRHRLTKKGKQTANTIRARRSEAYRAASNGE